MLYTRARARVICSAIEEFLGFMLGSILTRVRCSVMQASAAAPPRPPSNPRSKPKKVSKSAPLPPPQAAWAVGAQCLARCESHAICSAAAGHLLQHESNPKPQTFNPQSTTQPPNPNPKLQTLKRKSSTLNPKPKTPKPKVPRRRRVLPRGNCTGDGGGQVTPRSHNKTLNP